MKLKTIRVRRRYPSALSMALALMLTMLCVYIISLSGPGSARQVSAAVPAESEIHLAGLETVFHCAGRYDDRLDAQLAAARCVQSGGAGLTLLQDDQYAVVSHAGGEGSENSFTRSAPGLTMRVSGAAHEIAALNDAAALLQALHSETGMLDDSLQRRDTNASSVSALMEVYRTRAEQVQDGLIDVKTGSVVVSTLLEYVEKALVRIESTQTRPTVARLRLLHAAACADWIGMLEMLRSMAG